MKKSLLLLSSIFILSACGNPTTEQEVSTQTESSSVEVISTDDQENAIEVTISVEVPDEDYSESASYSVEEGALLLDVMKEHFDVEDDNNFITSINGYQQDADANMWWLFDLNGEMAEVGAHELELEDGDQVEWNLSAFE